MLEELIRAHLVTEHGCGRFSSHDLLRAYAVELAHARETDAGRHEALHRALDHYLHTGHAATTLLETRPRPGPLTEPRPGVAPETIADQEQALAWFAAEHAVLLAAVERADAAGMDGHTWQLAWTLATFLERRAHWDDWTAVLSTAVGAARRLSDRATEAWAHRGLSRACARLGRPEEAEAHYGCALQLYAALGDRTGLAHTHVNIGLALARQGRYREAMRHAQRAARHYQATDDRVSLAVALNNIGWYHAQLGCHDRALASCQRALALHQEAGNRSGEAETWDSLGYAHHHLGHHQSAITCYQHAIDLWHAMGDRSYEADALDHLGDTHRAAGDPASAQDAWRRALDILAEAGLSGADRIHLKLAGYP